MTAPASPWSQRLLALAAGVAAALAFPPFGLLPGVLGYGLMLRMADTTGPRPLRSAFFRGWLAGVGYFAVGVWWITEAFLVDAEAHGWMAPFALLLMAGGLALFWGLAALIYRAVRPAGWSRLFVFAAALSAMEWLRGNILTGFPWNLPGETWAAGSPPSQAAMLVGAYGLTYVTVALAAAPALLFDPVSRRARAVVAAIAVAVLGGLYAFGAARLATAAPPSVTAPMVRLVQADIDQKDKWKPENLPQVYASYMALTVRPARHAPDIVVWPEGALPAVIDDLLVPGSPYLLGLQDALKPGQTLMMGANRAGAGPDGGVAYYNSLVALRSETGGGLRVTGVYDKHRLVPFGEFLPLGDFATRLGIRSLVHMPEDFTAGPEPRPLHPAGMPSVQPMICYEALFPRFTARAAERNGSRPAWILNVSNDAWFGATSGPWQHLNIAGYRAIEEGLPIARATPTGVTAMLDAYGRIVDGRRLGLGQEGVIDARLPAALPPTPYSRFGEIFLATMLLVSGLMTVRRRRRGGPTSTTG
ncbi:MAG TPA: apolipoprotein N-acyltransferase [Phenylobacterium sp.]|nr:apolipoprotein N-acyltransferase [Phenylobacterium sp.]